MKIKQLCFLTVIILITVLAGTSCNTVPETATVAQETQGPTVIEEPMFVVVAPPRQEVFDPGRVTEQQYSATMDEVRLFIEELNRIIAGGNYQAWRARLSPAHFAEISSPQALHEVSEQPAMKTRRIILRTPEDYFTHVVVPSRANSRVDAIEFVDQNRVKAFTVNRNRAGEEVRLRLYDLEKTGDSWIIIN